MDNATIFFIMVGILVVSLVALWIVFAGFWHTFGCLLQWVDTPCCGG